MHNKEEINKLLNDILDKAVLCDDWYVENKVLKIKELWKQDKKSCL